MSIDYARMNREMPKLKAALTRAKKDPIKVLAAVEKALDVFDSVGAWPDQWATWRIALSDAEFAYRRDPGSWEADCYQDNLDRFAAVTRRFAW